MKKQLFIAALAATTMASVAVAGISITGKAKVNFTNTDYSSDTIMDTNEFKQDLDLYLTGTNGDTNVVINIGAIAKGGGDTSAEVNTISVEDAYVKTVVQGVTLKTGQWKNGAHQLRKATRKAGKFSASTSFDGIGLAYYSTTKGNDSVEISASANGFSGSYEAEQGGNTVILKGDFSGVNLFYRGSNSDTANSDKSEVTVSTDVSGISLAYSVFDADSAVNLSGDGVIDLESKNGTFGNTDLTAYGLTNGADMQALVISGSASGNTLKFKHVKIDADVNAVNAAASKDWNQNVIILTRPLAGGTTFEATYTDRDMDGTSKDYKKLDLELAVTF